MDPILNIDREYRSSRKAFFDQVTEYGKLYSSYGNQERLCLVAAEIDRSRDNFRQIAEQYGSTIQENELGKLEQYEYDCARIDEEFMHVRQSYPNYANAPVPVPTSSFSFESLLNTSPLNSTTTTTSHLVNNLPSTSIRTSPVISTFVNPAGNQPAENQQSSGHQQPPADSNKEVLQLLQSIAKEQKLMRTELTASFQADLAEAKKDIAKSNRTTMTYFVNTEQELRRGIDANSADIAALSQQIRNGLDLVESKMSALDVKYDRLSTCPKPQHVSSNPFMPDDTVPPPAPHDSSILGGQPFVKPSNSTFDQSRSRLHGLFANPRYNDIGVPSGNTYTKDSSNLSTSMNRSNVPPGNDACRFNELPKNVYKRDTSSDLAAFMLKQSIVNKNNFLFDGSPLRYVEFATHFKNSYCSTISDPQLLYPNLLGLLTGKALEAVKGTMILPPELALDEAWRILRDNYGNPTVILEAHKELLTTEVKVKDNLDDFSKLHTALVTYKSVQNYVDPNSLVGNFELICAITKRLSYRSSEAFMRSLDNANVLDDKTKWFDKLISFISSQMRVYQSALGRNVLSSRVSNVSKRSINSLITEDGDTYVEGDVSAALLNPTTSTVAPNTNFINNSSNILSNKVQYNSNKGKSTTEKQHHKAKPASSSKDNSSKSNNDNSNLGLSTGKCLWCKSKFHPTSACFSFLEADFKSRVAFVQKHNMCHRCLKPNEPGHYCPKTIYRKKGCKKGHHYVLCDCTSVGTGNTAPKTVAASCSIKTVSCCPVRLQVLQLDAVGPLTSVAAVHTMLDPGSQQHLISRKLADNMKLTYSSEKQFVLKLADGTSHSIVAPKVSFKVKNRSTNELYDVKDALVLDKLPDIGHNYPTTSNLENHAHLKDLAIHFPQVKDAELHILIGAKDPNLITPVEVRQADKGKPWGAKYPLGWVIYGEDDSLSLSSTTFTSAYLNTIELSTVDNETVAVSKFDLDKKLDRLLEVEFPESRHDPEQGLSVNDKKVISHYESTVFRSGKNYGVGLPFKNPDVCVPNNFGHAIKVLKAKEKSFEKNPAEFDLYANFMINLFKDGHAKVLSTHEINGKVGRVFYIDHHMVRTSFKPRVVFNCSGKYKGISLNGLLLKGPFLGPSLLDVLINFREFPFALVADLKKMYYQCFVAEEDQDFLRFLWWKDNVVGGEVIHCRMTRLAFGLLSAQSGAQFCLYSTIRSNQPKVSAETVDSLEKAFYVDDLGHSEPTPEQLVTFQSEANALLSSGGHILTKYGTSCRQLRSLLPAEDLIAECKTFNEENHQISDYAGYTKKTLGLVTSFEEVQGQSVGRFKFTVEFNVNTPTRSVILSSYSGIFDPIGFVMPLLVFPKQLMRELAAANYDWDDEISPMYRKKWEKWRSGMARLTSVMPNICLIPQQGYKSLEIHCFSDASNVAYAACCYVRAEYDNFVNVAFLHGKSKLAPSKKAQTVPKLELLAACLGVQIVRKVSTKLRSNGDISAVEYHVDAQSVLALINNVDSRYPVFVANRLSEIHDFTKSNQWKFCPGDQNPADIGSRVIMPQKMDKLNTWINGPEFLKLPREQWPKQPHAFPDSIVSSLAVTENDPDILVDYISHFSCYGKLRRAFVYLSRFKSFLRSKCTREVDPTLYSRPVCQEELLQSEKDLCRIVQRQVFPSVVEHLSSKMRRKRTEGFDTEWNHLKTLSPYLDDDHLLRVGGRMQLSDLPFDSKHQIILPKKHHLCDLIIWEYHYDSRHKGYHYVLARVREKYWILKGLSSVRSLLRECSFCRIRSATICKQMMAPLPKDRTVPGGRPFQICGCDMFGPEFTVVGRKKYKRYGCIWTCFKTRAIHVEMVYHMSTDAFLAAFFRFYYTRGCSISEIWSDNGSNFVAAAKELDPENFDFDEEQFVDTLGKKGICWTFIPPRAPHQGGLWERMVREVKTLLHAIYTQECYRTLSDDEFQTYLKEIENILNYRPLTSCSDDPTDFACLSPNSILNLGYLPVSSFCEPNRSDAYRKSWRTSQLMAEEFWKKWVMFYLPTLQRKSKWTSAEPNLKVGDLVLLIDNNPLKNQWFRARVSDTYPSKSGLVRKIEVVTPDRRKLIRDVRSVCLMEVDLPVE